MQQNQIRNRRVAVIGAGMAGLQAARTLAAASDGGPGFEVHVFDKARGVGGRTSLRRVDLPKGEQLTFDHGAQYFTARDPRFRQQVDGWIASGLCAPWKGRIGVIDRPGEIEDREAEPGEETERFVGVPGMNAMAKAMASGLAAPHRIEVTARATALVRTEGSDSAGPWRIELEDGRSLEGYDYVIVTTPPAQAAPLVSSSKLLKDVAEAVEMRPCWAAMVAFSSPLDVPIDGAFINSGPLSWACRNASKEGRGDADTWVLHATPEWTRDHIDLKREEAADLLIAALGEALGAALPVPPAHASAHRWMYSGALEPRHDVCAWDEASGLGLAGDWLNGSKVQGAWLSGLTLAERILASRA